MLKNKKLKYLVLSGLISVTVFTAFAFNSNANTTLPYKEVDGVQYINIVELAKLKGEQVSEATHEVHGTGYNLTIDGKLVTIYDNAQYIFIDGRMTALKTEVISADGTEYNYPVMEKPIKDGDGFLIPMLVIENSLGIKGTSEGIVVETPKEEDKEDTNTGNESNNGSNNSDSTNNGGSNNGSSNSGNNGSSNNGGSNNGGSNNGGGTTTPKPEQPKPEPPKPETPKPEPPKPETPKPEPPKPEVPKPEPPKPEAPSGMSFSTFASKLPGMGFDGSGVYWEGENKMGVVYASSSEATFSLRQNSASFNSVIKNCLNMLLPTGGNKVYNIVSSPFSNQTLKLDGRTVTIEQTGVGVGIKIYNN